MINEKSPDIVSAEATSEDLWKILDLVSSKQFALSLTVNKDQNGIFTFQIEAMQKNLFHSNQGQEYLDGKEAAQLVHHSSYWLSRRVNREKYGIKVHKSGGRNMFMRKELVAMLERNQEKKRGRPRKALMLKITDEK